MCPGSNIRNSSSVQGPSVEHDKMTGQKVKQKKSALYSKIDTITTVMQVVKTSINNKEVNVMFDSGSDRSFIREG